MIDPSCVLDKLPVLLCVGAESAWFFSLRSFFYSMHRSIFFLAGYNVFQHHLEHGTMEHGKSIRLPVNKKSNSQNLQCNKHSFVPISGIKRTFLSNKILKRPWKPYFDTNKKRINFHGETHEIESNNKSCEIKLILFNEIVKIYSICQKSLKHGKIRSYTRVNDNLRANSWYMSIILFSSRGNKETHTSNNLLKLSKNISNLWKHQTHLYWFDLFSMVFS